MGFVAFLKGWIPLLTKGILLIFGTLLFIQGYFTARLYTQKDEHEGLSRGTVLSYDVASFFQWFGAGLILRLLLSPFEYFKRIAYYVDKLFIALFIIGVVVYSCYSIYSLNAIAKSDDPKLRAAKAETVPLSLLGLSLGVMASYVAVLLSRSIQIENFIIMFLSLVGVAAGINGIVLYYKTNKPGGYRSPGIVSSGAMIALSALLFVAACLLLYFGI